MNFDSTGTTPEWAEWSEAPLTASERAARDRMLTGLTGVVVARRRKRIAARTLAAMIVVVAGLAGMRALMAPGAPRAISPNVVASGAGSPKVERSVAAVIEAPAERTAPLVRIVATDPGILERYAAPSRETAIITVLDDDGLAKALADAGMPGLVRIDGRIVLSREHRRDETGGPQSRGGPTTDGRG